MAKRRDVVKRVAVGSRSGLRRALGRLAPGRIAEERLGEGALTSRAIAGVDTSTTAFVGAPAAGAPSQPVELTSFVDYERAFGSTNGELGRAVRLYFENGGRRAYAVRAAGGLADGLQALEAVRFSVLAVPDAAALDPEQSSQIGVAAHQACERRRAFLLLDPPASLAPTDAAGWATELGSLRNAAAYVPRLRRADGTEAAASGAVAGILARTDSERGVWKAPAGSHASVRGVTDITVPLSDESIDLLTATGVNVVRRLATGLVLWGARTLAASPSEWRYINVRRLALFLERSIDEGTRWAAFEPNGEALWSEIRRSVDEFMLGVFAQGAFGGRTAEDAYFVRCDRTTMTEDDIANGRLVIVVGFAPVPPAEFVVVRIG